MITLSKTHTTTDTWVPLEKGTIRTPRRTARILVADGIGRVYLDRTPQRGLSFVARGAAGLHRIAALDTHGTLLATATFRLKPATTIACDRGIYARLADRAFLNMAEFSEHRFMVVEDRLRIFNVCWLRDHNYSMKAMKWFITDVTSGTQFFLEKQQANGMIWDDIHRNKQGGPTWFGEALGKGWFDYADGKKWVLRRIPVEADVEYLAVEAVHQGWKASGDDAWMRTQLPRLEKALHYATTSPQRWSRIHGLVKRAYTMDSWDFKHPDPAIGGGGDHRCLAPGDKQPFFLFHGDNSGYFMAFSLMSDMYAALGDGRRAKHHRTQAEALRQRANKLLWKSPIYAHMVPEKSMPGLKAKVGDDTKRMSLSLGYTVNRGLPDHQQAVRLIDEYQRRGRAQAKSSFAEWWSMDPMYTDGQWGDGNATHQSLGEYMNGAVSPLVAGELARAAFEHGREAYGADILRRFWELTEADDGNIADCYRRLPPGLVEPDVHQRQKTLDIRAYANVGLHHGATRGVMAWTNEGDNDLRGLPTGRQQWENVAVEVIAPQRNSGKAIIALSGTRLDNLPVSVVVPVPSPNVGCFYVLHALGRSRSGLVGWYDLLYADGTEHRFPLTNGHQLGSWWGPSPLGDQHSGPEAGRIVWRGPNPTCPDVGMYLTGFTNPRPTATVVAIRLTAEGPVKVMIGGITIGDGAARFSRGIRSFGLPGIWSQAAIYHALAEGLGGVIDTDRSFNAAEVRPRWAATEATKASACVHYPASDGYCSYTWQHDAKRRCVIVDVTGNADHYQLKVLMPSGRTAKSAHIDGEPIGVTTRRLESSVYADLTLKGLPRAPVIIRY